MNTLDLIDVVLERLLRLVGKFSALILAVAVAGIAGMMLAAGVITAAVWLTGG